MQSMEILDDKESEYLARVRSTSKTMGVSRRHGLTSDMLNQINRLLSIIEKQDVALTLALKHLNPIAKQHVINKIKAIIS